MRLEILKYIYQHFIESGVSLCYVPFPDISEHTQEVNQTLKNLETDGFIETSSPAIASIYARLTNYGLSFCEQTFRL